MVNAESSQHSLPETQRDHNDDGMEGHSRSASGDKSQNEGDDGRLPRPTRIQDMKAKLMAVLTNHMKRRRRMLLMIGYISTLAGLGSVSRLVIDNILD